MPLASEARRPEGLLLTVSWMWVVVGEKGYCVGAWWADRLPNPIISGPLNPSLSHLPGAVRVWEESSRIPWLVHTA